MNKLLKLLTSENITAKISGDDTFSILHTDGSWIELPADCVRDYLRGGSEPFGC